MSYAEKRRQEIREWLVALVMASIFISAFIWAVGTGLDQSIDNQNVMLCESAKTSGNVETFEKCKPYYENKDIKKLREVL